MEKLSWTNEGNKYFLKSGESILMTLQVYPAATAEFNLNGKKYVISTKGIWNPCCYITSEEKEILKLTHNFWSSKGKIVFLDGTECNSEYTSRGGLKLRFSEAEKEVLSYGVSFENKRPHLIFKLGFEMIDAEKLLILAALGMTMFSSLFKEIAGESDSTTLPTLLLLSTA